MIYNNQIMLNYQNKIYHKIKIKFHIKIQNNWLKIFKRCTKQENKDYYKKPNKLKKLEKGKKTKIKKTFRLIMIKIN